MPSLLALALQAAAAPAAPMAGIDFDLALLPRGALDLSARRRACANPDAGTIIVCARPSGGAYPLAEMERIYGPLPPLRAETDLGGGATGSAFVQQVTLDRGAVANRVMIGIRTRF